MPKFTGTGASDGISIAKIFKLEESKFNIKKESIKDPSKELKLLNDSLAKAKKDLQKLEAITKEKLGEEKADIFKAHLLMLEDPSIIEEVKSMVKENINLAYSVFSSSNKQADMLAKMDDDYLKERAADVKDVFSRLLKYILGIPVLDLATISEEVIIAADDLTPSQTAQLNPKFVKGFICNIGGRTSHAAIMARSLRIPAVLGLKNITSKIANGDLAIIDGKSGIVITKPSKSETKKFEGLKLSIEIEKKELLSFKTKKTISKDGKSFLVESNIGSVKDVAGALEFGADGVGLFRSEFLYMDNDHFPTEDEQFNSYKEVLKKMNNKIVIIRTLDIGGDKTLSYFKFPKEMNPFLGYRAIRLCLDKVEVFKTQLRALLRASAYGKLGIMFPMIATIDEFLKAKKIVLDEKAKLIKKGIKVGKDVQIGMMVEVPSTAVNAKAFAKYSDFFSIGTNDLIQYTFAADRMSERVSYLYQPYNPSLLKLIKMTIDGAHSQNKWVGMCGEVAGDEKAIPLLLGLGLDAFSMSATSILKARKIISSLSTVEMKKIAEKAMELDTNDQVLDFINKNIKY